jgi:hypothetical protein
MCMYSLHRSTWFIVFFWMASMSWLSWTKLRPAVRLGQSPQQDDVLPREAVRLSPIRWRIFLNGEPLGWAVHDVERFLDGRGRVDSTVRIERLPVEQALQQGFGSLGSLLSRGLARESAGALGTLSLTIESSMRFDHFGQLEGFESTVLEDRRGECIRIVGSVRETQLLVKAYLLLGFDRRESVREPVYQDILHLPADKLVVDSLAPRPRLRELSVGQHWTFETYHPFFPTRPLQTLEARVEDRRMLRIDDQDVWTFHVVYQRSADDGLSLERRVGDVFVTADGTVVRQTLTWGGITLSFDLLPESADVPVNAAGNGGRGGANWDNDVGPGTMEGSAP